LNGSHNISKLDDFLLYLILYLGESFVSSKNSLEIVESLFYLLLNRLVSGILGCLLPDFDTPGELECPLSEDFWFPDDAAKLPIFSNVYGLIIPPFYRYSSVFN
jgi:hypothetical protein